MNRRAISGMLLFILPGVAAGALYFLFFRPQMLRWGTRLGESQRRLPGDDLIPRPTLQATRAIDIDAPPEAVWPWLAQLGRDKTGWYSLDILYNNGIPSAAYLRPDLPEPQPGMMTDQGYRIEAVEPGRMLLFAAVDAPNGAGSSTDSSRLYLLERKSDGSARLLVRLRAHSYGPGGSVRDLLYELLDFVTVTRQLQAIKQRAETMAYLHASPQEHEIPLT